MLEPGRSLRTHSSLFLLPMGKLQTMMIPSKSGELVCAPDTQDKREVSK